MLSIRYEHRRITWADGAWADVNTAHADTDALEFVALYRLSSKVAVQNIAHLRHTKALRRTDSPNVLVWTGNTPMMPASIVHRRSEVRTDDDEVLLTADAFINYALRTLVARGWLNIFNGDWIISVPHGEKMWLDYADSLARYLAAAQKRDRVYFMGEDLSQCDVSRDILGIGRCGFVSDAVQRSQYQLAFNTSFFLLESDDWFSHYSMLGDSFGMWIHDRKILQPPLYDRAAIWKNEGGWHVGTVGMQDIEIRTEGGDYSNLPVNPTQETDTAIYTRYFGVERSGYPFGKTPESPNRLELVIIDAGYLFRG